MTNFLSKMFSSIFKEKIDVRVEEATEIKLVCEIEESISIGVDEHFPFEWLNTNGSMARFDCRKRLGLEKK